MTAPSRPDAQLIDLEYKVIAKPEFDDEGSFTALIATHHEDRDRERFLPGAFREAVERFKASSVRLPVLWNHDAATPDSLIGSVHNLDETDDGLVAEGRFDLDSGRGRDIHRLLKRGAALGWSFGFAVPRSARKPGGIITAVREIYEATVTALPANPRTRLLALKDFRPDPEPDRVPTQAELERELIRHGIISEPANAGQYRQADPVLTGQGANGDEETKDYEQASPSEDELRYRFALLTDPDLEALHRTERDRMLALLARDDEHKTVTAPVQVATFEC